MRERPGPRRRRPSPTGVSRIAVVPWKPTCPPPPIRARSASASSAAGSAIRPASGHAGTPFYIACLKLTGRRCVVVGGGEIGLEKVEGLLACDGASCSWRRRRSLSCEELAAEGSIEWIRRDYEPGDLERTFIAIAATDDTDTNIRVFEDAERRAMLVNIVDVPPLCNFILPAIVAPAARDRDLHRGRFPGAGQAIKRQVAEEYGEEYARLAIMLNEVRGWAKGTLPTYQDRKAFFEGIVNGEPDPIELLRAGDEGAVLDLIEAARRSQAPAAL